MIHRLKEQLKKFTDKKDIGVAMYDFDFSNEFRIYENVCMLRCNNISDYQSFSSWKTYIEQKYGHLTKDEIQSFLFYLDCLTEELLHGKEVSTKLATSLFSFVLGGLSLLGISNLNDIIERIGLSLSTINPVAAFLFIIMTVPTLLSAFLIVISQMLEYKSKYNFLSKYKEIIRSLDVNN